jgi:hypothetical protein
MQHFRCPLSLLYEYDSHGILKKAPKSGVNANIKQNYLQIGKKFPS